MGETELSGTERDRAYRVRLGSRLQNQLSCVRMVLEKGLGAGQLSILAEEKFGCDDVRVTSNRTKIIIFNMLYFLILLVCTECLFIQQLTCSRCNTLSPSSYTLTLTPSIQLLHPATIHILFPVGYDLTHLSNTSFSLLPTTNTLTITLPSLLKNNNYTFTIDNVVNPNAGSSGVFAVKVYQSSLLIEQNMTAGAVGIGGPEGVLVHPSVYLDPNSRPTAGEIAYYNFVFTIGVSVGYRVSIRIWVPQQFEVPAVPTCSIFSINSQDTNSTVGCYSSDGRTIIIDNYQNGTVTNGTRVALKISLLNPNKTGTTGTFSIYVFKANTSYVVSSYENIPGVTIQHGLIYSAQWTRYNPYAIQAKNKTQDYLLSFTPKNPLSAINSVTIDIPNGFMIVKGTTYDYVRVIQGITGGVLSWDNYQIQIANGSITGNVRIIMRLINPQIAGSTNTLTISTYDNQILVDQNSDLSTVISDVSSQQLAIFSSFSISFSTLNSLPSATLSVSNLQVNNPLCSFYSNPSTCYSLNGQIFIGSTHNFQPLTQYSLAISNINYDPGTYLMDYQITSGSLVQSSTAVVIIPPNSFQNAALSFIDGQISNPPDYTRKGILNVSMTTDYALKGVLMITSNINMSNAMVKILKGLVAPKESSISIQFITDMQVQISDFVVVPTNTYIEIHLVNVTNPTGAADVTVQVRNQLETTLSLVVYDVATLTVAVDKTATMQNGYTAVNWTMSSGLVGTEFSLTFQPFFNGDITNSVLILELPGYDTMFIREKNVIACKIDSTFYPCISYFEVDWILIRNISYLPMQYANGSRPTITIYGLEWPTYTDTVGYLLWRSLDSTTFYETDRKTLGNFDGNTTFPRPNTTLLSAGSLSVSDSSSGSPGTTFSFTFTTPTLLPSLSNITLSFPPTFSLNTSTPLPTITCPMFSSHSLASPLAITIYSTSIVFSNISAIPPLSSFTITIKGVKMPTVAVPSVQSNFSITVTKNGRKVTELSAFDRVDFAGVFTVDRLEGRVMLQRPVVDMASQYRFQLTPYHSIPQGGQIRILFGFDLQFTSCQLEGSISNFDSCTVGADLKTLTVTLGEDYYTGAFNITLQDVINPTVAKLYTFQISTYYDNTLMDSTSLTQSLYPVPSTITASVLANPSTQGQWGVFNLTVTLTQPADSIFVQLSNEFSSATQEMQFEGEYQAGTFYLSFGAINPAGSSAIIGVMSWLDGVAKQKADVAYISSPAAQWLELYQYSLSDNRVGRYSQLQLQMHIPSLPTTAQLQLHFPSQFSCTSSTLLSSSAPLTLSINPTAQSHLLFTSPTPLTSTILNLNFSLLTPNVSGNYSFTAIILENQQVLSKTFSSLDYVEIPIYDVGPGFWVNANQTVFVYEKTLSNQVEIAVEYPSRYGFTIEADSQLEIIPKVITISEFQRKATFQVVGNEASGKYWIRWKINSSQYHKFYNPIPQTIVMVQPCPILHITIQSPNPIPINGSSLPLELSVPFLPTTPIELTLTLPSPYFLLTPNTPIVFTSTSAYFQINSTAPSFFSSASFTAQSNHSNFTVLVGAMNVISLPWDGDAPVITELTVVAEGRDQVVLSLGVSELALVMVVVRRWFEQVPMADGWRLNTDGAVWSSQLNLTSSVQQRFTVTGLESSQHYIVYCLAVDRANLVSGMRSLEIETLAHQKAIQVLIPFSQPNITVHQQNNFLIPQLTFYLSLPTGYVLTPYTSTFHTNSQAARYISGVYYQPLWIVVPDSYTVEQVTEQLSSSRSYLQQSLQYLAVGVSPITTMVNWNVPGIVGVNVSQSIGEVSVSVVAGDYGIIYVSVYPRQLNYSYQIKQMQNCTGVMTIQKIYLCKLAVETNTDYLIHVAIGDIGPLFPTLNPNFTLLPITSLPPSPIYHLNINSLDRLHFCLFLLALLLQA